MAEVYTIKMPKLSDTMTEGTVVTWEKQVGEQIARGTVVATVETDKACTECPKCLSTADCVNVPSGPR